MLNTVVRAFSAPTPQVAMPKRVRDAIAHRQEQGERLIGWCQLVVGAVWCALYLLAPAPVRAEGDLEPVPIALGIYLGFSLLRLAVLYRSTPPTWFLAIAVLIDMAVLMALIWSFHLQYAQPAAFYLKAPTLLYVFIFIALRALRFSVGYLLWAGLVAAVGWLVLLVYALYESELPMMGITRDYVQYMTSTRVLIGGEFDKIIAILLTTAILALAIARARQILIAAVVEQAAHDDLERFFAPEVAREIVGAEDDIHPGQGSLREAAVLMADIRGFTSLAAQVPPDRLMADLADYQRRVVAVVRAHGGVVDKFLGDGVMVTFGANAATPCYAADALRAIDDLDREMIAWNESRRAAGRQPLAVNFAATSGPLVFGAVGDESRLEFTVIGEAVNLAAKIEKANKREGVRALTTRETYELARRQGYEREHAPEQRPARPVEGVEDALDLVVLAA